MLRVVPDANRVAAALIKPSGWSAGQLRRRDVAFFAPEFLWAELRGHADSYAAKAGCSVEEFHHRVEGLASLITSVTEADLVAHAHDPLVQACLQVDPDDAVYFACLCAVDGHFLWTNDDALWKHFRSVCVRLMPETSS